MKAFRDNVKSSIQKSLAEKHGGLNKFKRDSEWKT